MTRPRQSGGNSGPNAAAQRLEAFRGQPPVRAVAPVVLDPLTRVLADGDEAEVGVVEDLVDSNALACRDGRGKGGRRRLEVVGLEVDGGVGRQVGEERSWILRCVCPRDRRRGRVTVSRSPAAPARPAAEDLLDGRDAQLQLLPARSSRRPCSARTRLRTRRGGGGARGRSLAPRGRSARSELAVDGGAQLADLEVWPAARAGWA